jgi:hypothetical protein
VEIGLAARPEILCAVMIAHQCRRTEVEKGENPVNTSDDAGADGASRQRLDAETTDHRRVADA